MSNPYGNDPYGQQQPNPYGQQPQNPYGGGAGGGSSYPPPPGGGGFEQPKTDGVSVAALVTGILCCTVGLIPIILGFIGLSRTKGGQRKGRGFAIAGIILGIVGLIGTAAVIVIAVATDVQDIRSIDDLEKGQCINASGLKSDEKHEVGIIKEVDCTDKHDGQVIATKTLSADEADNYDFEDESQVGEQCGSMIDPSLAATLLDPKYFLLALTQSKSPDEGDQVVCIVSLANGDDLTEDLL
ncbi:DUF4190 domain-containing protein [Nocardioides sp. MH1]|uniref:DUF4190 domain-containing protein n=1 Tax=Nocardioides sp. MH1 TaxID=3242490 RepID=UPI0035220E2A